MTLSSRAATISECGTYRYDLTRRWGHGGTVCWVMLNPSTADAEVDDPTIRRCMGFARSWGYGGIVVVNQFALRATNPKALREHSGPRGPLNAEIVEVHLGQSALTVAAWGAFKFGKGLYALDLLGMQHRTGKTLWSLGKTANGSPPHPLYISADRKPEIWRNP